MHKMYQIKLNIKQNNYTRFTFQQHLAKEHSKKYLEYITLPRNFTTEGKYFQKGNKVTV